MLMKVRVKKKGKEFEIYWEGKLIRLDSNWMLKSLGWSYRFLCS